MTRPGHHVATPKRVGSRRRLELGLAAMVGVAAIAVFVWKWPFELDVQTATVAELIEASEPGSPWRGLPGPANAVAACRELLARAASEVDAEIERAALDASADLRVAAASARARVIESDECAQDSARRARHIERLLTTLDDRDVEVQRRAFLELSSVSHCTTVTPSAKWFEVGRDLLAARNVALRLFATYAAIPFGRRAQPFVPALVACGHRETDTLVRRMVACTLGATGTNDEDAVRLLVSWLGDAEAEVSSRAAASLGELRAVTAIQPLLALARAAGPTGEERRPAWALTSSPMTPADARRCALTALTELVSTPGDVNAVLELLFEDRPPLDEYEILDWCDEVGRTATASPTASSVRRARERLREVARAEDSGAEVEAISALVRIAVAARDELPSAADVECLWGAAPRDSESRWAAFEALVALARWPESGVSAASLRPMLESLRDSRENSVRERVERLLARLPR